MKKSKIKNLEDQGWKVSGTAEFLGLSPQEMEIIEIKLTLSKKFKEIREQKKLTQQEAAELIHSSQSRVAKLEAGDPTVSLDLHIRSLIGLGITRKDVGQYLAH